MLHSGQDGCWVGFGGLTAPATVQQSCCAVMAAHLQRDGLLSQYCRHAAATLQCVMA